MVGVLVVAVDLTKFLEDVSAILLLALGDDELVYLHSLIIDSLSLEKVSNLIEKLRVANLQPDGLRESKTCLLESLLSIVETKNGVKSPDVRVEVVQDVSLGNGILSCI